MRSLRWVWISAAILAVLAALAAGIATRNFGGPQGRLGSVRVTLVGADFGVAHVLPRPGWWERLRSIWLPNTTPIPPAYSTRTPSVGVWIRSNVYPFPGAPPGSWELTDSHGCRFPISTWGAWYQSPRQKGADWLQSAAYDAFPRNDPFLRIAYYRKGEKDPVLLWITRNPAPSAVKQNLAPQPFPIHYRARGYDFILRKIGAGSIWQRPVSLASFSVRDGRTGKETRAWRVVSITAADAFGNRATTRVRPGSPAAFQGFCTKDGAWRLDATFAPPPEAPVAGQWDWETPSLQLPGPAQVSPTNCSVTRDGVTLRAVSVRSPRWRPPGIREITLRVVAPFPVQVSLVRASGKSGAPIQSSLEYERVFVHTGGSTDHRLTLTGITSERSVRAVLRVQPLVTARYVAQP